MSQNLIQASGGQAQKPTRFVSLFTSRFMTGLYTNRSLLRGPLQAIYSDFYHLGSTDALCDGLNTELSIRQTMTRRPGNVSFSSAPTGGAIDSFYSFQHTDGSIQVIADSSTDVEIVTSGTNTSLFTKAAGAGQGYFNGIDNSLYVVDGIDTLKYIPGTTNPRTGNSLWNFGGVAPTVAPVIGTPIASTGGATGSQQWVNACVFSTMGIVIDSNGNAQQLVSVNASTTNTTQFGTSGTGAPAFATFATGTVTESAGTPITWTCQGSIIAWQPNTVFNNISNPLNNGKSACIYDPVSKSCYVNIAPGNAQGTSSTKKPAFNGVFASIFYDGSVKWLCIGNPDAPGLWKPNTSYPTPSPDNYTVDAVVTPVTCVQAGIGSTNSQTVYLQFSSGGTSSPNPYFPNWATTYGSPSTSDGDLVWNYLGSATRQNSTNYAAWSASAQYFGVIQVSVSAVNYLYVCTESTGPTASSAPSFSGATLYGQTVQDGTNPGTANFVGVTWTCVGKAMTWVASTKWYLPAGGFVPPQQSQSYGGAVITDGTNSQYCVSSGFSGGSAPSWGTPGNNTTDGTVTWYCLKVSATAGFTWTKGYGYCVAFKARTSSDVACTQAPPLQIPGTNSPNITGPLGPPTGCTDGTITTASPVAQLVGPNSAGAIIPLTITGSTDPQFDTIEVYRSTDGFQAAGPYLYLTDIPMPPPVGNKPGVVTIYDFMPDTATALLPGLDPLIEAPVDHVNDPPPGQYGSTQFVPASAATPTVPAAGTAIVGLEYHQGRLWGFIGNSVFASGGPDTDPGNGFTAWNPSYEFPFNSQIVRLISTATALLVFTTTDIFLIGGGPAITDYYSQLLVPGIGLSSWNAVCMVMGLPYIFTSQRQLITVDPSGGITRVGHPIGDKLVGYNPSSVYVTYHAYGDQEHAIFISNGSNEWYRCDPNPTPDSQLTGPVWSPRATLSSGFKAMASIVTAPGTQSLLLGPTSAGTILNRDSTFTTFTDNGSAYDAYFTMGNIVLAHPGQMAECAFIEGDFTQVGTQPSVFVLMDELSPTSQVPFEKLSNVIVSDPPKKYGPSGTPQTLWMNRYNFGQTTPGNGGEEVPLPAWCKSMQIKCDFGNTDTVQNEMLAFSIYGALYQEK